MREKRECGENIKYRMLSREEEAFKENKNTFSDFKWDGIFIEYTRNKKWVRRDWVLKISHTQQLTWSKTHLVNLLPGKAELTRKNSSSINLRAAIIDRSEQKGTIPSLPRSAERGDEKIEETRNQWLNGNRGMRISNTWGKATEKYVNNGNIKRERDIDMLENHAGKVHVAFCRNT